MPSASSQAAIFMGQYGAKPYSVHCVYSVKGFGYFITLPHWGGYCVYSVHCVNGFAISK